MVSPPSPALAIGGTDANLMAHVLCRLILNCVCLVLFVLELILLRGGLLSTGEGAAVWFVAWDEEDSSNGRDTKMPSQHDALSKMM